METPEELLETLRIRRVLERWSTGIDRGDVDLVKSTYWPDGLDDHGRWKGNGWDFAEWVIPVLRANYAATLHTLNQSHIRVFDAFAACETYAVAYHRIERQGQLDIEVAHGRYIDRMERRSGEWKIASRDCIMENYFTHENVEATCIGMEEFARGARGPEDPFYRLVAELAPDRGAVIPSA